jgi:N-acetylglucosaminyl-diphospho-decaprenol L-rhamnosyltransferase
MIPAGVVVVTYNSSGVIGDCLDSCAGLPIVVVDNASSDGTLDAIGNRPNVRPIANSRNRGFAAAVNQGVAALDADLILLLNPDVELRTSIDALIEACRIPETGIAAGKLVDPSGRAQAGFNVRRLPQPVTLVFEALGWNRLWRGNPVNRRYRCLDLDPEQPAEVEQPAGAFLMFHRDAWERLEGFDEQFHPLWFEDVDFCKRAKDLGVRVRYVPEVVAVHLGGHSVAGLTSGCRELYWYASLLRYASKHFRSIGYRGVSGAVALGSVLRALAGVFQLRSLKPIAVHARVVRLALLCMFSGRVRKPGGWAGYSKAVG